VIRRVVWPLPVVQSWNSTPDPVEGWMAEVGGAGRGGGTCQLSGPVGMKAIRRDNHASHAHLPRAVGRENKRRPARAQHNGGCLYERSPSGAVRGSIK
jgi:hypothetical protein